MKEWLGITGEINNWADLLDTRLGSILKTVGAIGVAFGAWKIGGMIVTSIGTIKTAIDGAAGALAAAKTAVLATTGVSLGSIAAVVGAIVALVAGLAAVYLTNEDVKKSVDNAVASIGNALVPLFEFMTGTVIPNLKSAWDGLLVILQPLGDWIAMVFTSIWQDMLIPQLEWIGSTVVPTVTDCFKDLWNNVLVPLGTFIGSVMSPVISILGEVLTWLWQYVVVPIADFVGGVFATVWEASAKVFRENVIPNINQVISVLQFLWNYVLAPVVDFVWGVWGPVFKEAFKFIGDQIKAAKDIFSGLINFVTGIFTKDWDQAWSGIVQLFSGIFSVMANNIKLPLNLALTYVESFVNKIIDGWNWLKKQINKLSIEIPDWLGGGKLGFNLAMSSKVTLPRFADGGYPAEGQMFIANEAGPELVGSIGNRSAVVNNDQIVAAVSKGVYQAVVQAMGQSGNQTVEAKVNDKVLFEVVVNRNRQETMRTGYNPLLGGV
jgi:phage-related protein